jgi:hypothetical protein
MSIPPAERQRIQWQHGFRNRSLSYRRLVVAISSGLRNQHAVAGSDIDMIAAEIIGQQGRMPDYLRFPIRFATWLFDWSGVMSGGRRFQSKDEAAQLTQLIRWKNSRFGACRNFIRFYESLFLLIALQEEVA